jgi:hypothetical protein
MLSVPTMHLTGPRELVRDERESLSDSYRWQRSALGPVGVGPVKYEHPVLLPLRSAHTHWVRGGSCPLPAAGSGF